MLAALVNGLLLVAVGVGIAVAAIGRLSDPPSIDGAGVLALGALGLAGNLAATLVLARGQREDINLEGVLRHSAADALGSLGVVLAGAFVLLGGSAIVDPIVGLLIAGLVLASSWRLIKEPFDVLMESAPADLDVEGMGAAICEEEGVRSVHDLHVWTVTAGFGAIAAHVVVSRDCDRDLVRRRLELTLRDRFGIEHTTLQMEEEASTRSPARRERAWELGESGRGPPDTPLFVRRTPPRLPLRDRRNPDCRLFRVSRSEIGAWLASDDAQETPSRGGARRLPPRCSSCCSPPPRRRPRTCSPSSKPSSRSWKTSMRRRAC